MTQETKHGQTPARAETPAPAGKAEQPKGRNGRGAQVDLAAMSHDNSPNSERTLETDMIRETIQEQVCARALKDPSFRQALQSNPRTVLAEQYNVQLPEGIAVRVVEE